MGCHCLLRQRLLAVLWRLNLCRRKRSSPTGDQAACCAGQVGAHRRDEFHPFVQDVAAGSHGGGVGRGGPGACGPRRPGSGSSLRAGRPQGFRGLSPSSCPGRTSWKSARPQRWLCRFHGALRNPPPPVPRPPFLPRSVGRWPALQSRLVLVVGEAQREVGAGGGGCTWTGWLGRLRLWE